MGILAATYNQPLMAWRSPTSHNVFLPLSPVLTASFHNAEATRGLLLHSSFYLSRHIYLALRVGLRNLLQASIVVLRNTWYATVVAVVQTIILGSLCTRVGYRGTGRVLHVLYQRSEPLRQLLFFEFMVWILNPNAVALFIFWPGWLLVGAVYLVWPWIMR